MTKIKGIRFKMNLEGQGVVNFDGDVDKFCQKQLKGFEHINPHNKNYKFAKKVYRIDEEGKLDYKLKISSACLRHEMFTNPFGNTPISIINTKLEWYHYILSSCGLLRGYMFTQDKLPTIRRKSPITICDAIQTNDAKSFMEIGTQSGNIHNDSEISLHTHEQVGDITYTAEGFINIQELRFFSCSLKYDRLGINPDILTYINDKKENIADTVLKNLYGKDAKYDIGLFYYNEFAKASELELGILLGDEITINLVKDALMRMFDVYIKRSGSFAKVKNIEIQLVSDVLDTSNEWIELNSHSDIVNLNFEVDNAYKLSDKEYLDAVQEEKESYKNFKKVKKENKRNK